MERLGDIHAARGKVADDIGRCLKSLREIIDIGPGSLEDGLACLNRVRATVYEDLNQIPHEYAIICAAEWLVSKKRCPADTVWHWNARQTGLVDEPDLRGSYGDKVILSAEITTSVDPQGLIDSRMKHTLRKLSGMAGERFYFAGSRAMCQRANTKIRKAGWLIEPVQLDGLITISHQDAEVAHGSQTQG